MPETFTVLNKHNNYVCRDMPKIVIRGPVEDATLKRIALSSGLDFLASGSDFTATPDDSHQVIGLLLSCDFITGYHFLGGYRGVLYLTVNDE